MKKLFTGICIILTVLVLIMVMGPRDVSACAPTPPPASKPIDGGSWDRGSDVNIDLETYPAPSWLQLMGNAVKVNSAGTVCHPFLGAQYGWNGEIRRLVDGKWVKLTTTTSQANMESDYMSCAKAPGAGTYALFGYYTGE